MRWIRFWTEDLWNFRLSELRGWKRRWIRSLRIGSMSVQGFFTDECMTKASSLTYYALMSIVPIIALFFAIARGFGYQEHLRAQLYKQFIEHQAAFSEIVNFADRLIAQTSGGILAAIGIAILLWTVLSMISSMEEYLNAIWHIRKMRSWRRLISEYFGFLLIAPIFFVISSSIAVFIQGYLELIASAWIIQFFINLVPFALFWFFFSFLYYFLPNTKVRIGAAFVGGIVAGTLYVALQWAYIYFQLTVSRRYGAIYGSFAALPLFLIWLQISWYIFLYGAEVSYAYQYLETQEFAPALEKASPCFRKSVSLWILQFIVRRFVKSHSLTTLRQILAQCHIPMNLTVTCIKDLLDAGLLIEGKADSYLPGRPAESLRISDALQALEMRGSSDFPFIHSHELEKFEEALRSFAEMIEGAPGNQLIHKL